MPILPRRVLFGPGSPFGAIGASAAIQRTASSTGRQRARLRPRTHFWRRWMTGSGGRRTSISTRRRRSCRRTCPLASRCRSARRADGLKLGSDDTRTGKGGPCARGRDIESRGFTKGHRNRRGRSGTRGPKCADWKASGTHRFGRGEYYVSILGKPSTTELGDPVWRPSSRSQRDTRGSASMLTPTHTGTQPPGSASGEGWVRPLGQENDRAFELIDALNAEQQNRPSSAIEVRDLVLGPGTDGKTIAPEGVRASGFTPAQRKLCCSRSSASGSASSRTRPPRRK